jgi:hypothetical protein
MVVNFNTSLFSAQNYLHGTEFFLFFHHFIKQIPVTML